MKPTVEAVSSVAAVVPSYVLSAAVIPVTAEIVACVICPMAPLIDAELLSIWRSCGRKSRPNSP